jgi:hypothetical protein
MNMSFGSKKTTSDQSTKISNQQATASENSVAVGAGANVNIQNVSDKVVDIAVSSNEQIASRALDTVKDLSDDNAALQSQFNRTSSELASGTIKQGFDFAKGIATETNRTVASSLSEANDVLARAQQNALSTVQRSSGVSDSTIASESNRNLLILGGVGIVAIAFITSNKGKN